MKIKPGIFLSPKKFQRVYLWKNITILDNYSIMTLTSQDLILIISISNAGWACAVCSGVIGYISDFRQNIVTKKFGAI